MGDRKYDHKRERDCRSGAAVSMRLALTPSSDTKPPTMPRRRLHRKDIEQLIAGYRGERARLMFQLDNLRTVIKDLRKQLANAPEKKDVSTRRARTSVGSSASDTVPRGRRKSSRSAGYRLNPWDLMVTDTISKRGRLLRKEEILEAAKTWARKTQPRLKNADVETKITRTLQKLSGKRNVLGTHRTGLQRGYHYGLKEWFFASTGKLRSRHLDKLVIDKK